MEDASLAGQTVTFSAYVSSNTLVAGYTNVAFIKGLNPANGYSTDVLVTAPLTPGENFSITAAAIPAGLIVQYGFAITGLNGNPAHEAANGNVLVTAATLSVAVTPTKTSLYPNPAKNILHLTSTKMIEELTVFNMFGQQVLASKSGSMTQDINVSGLTNGMYILNTKGQNFENTTRFIKE